MSPRSEFLYLSEPDMVSAGVLDTDRCVDTIEEVFRILDAGDYLMGGPNHNSHGMGLVFPKESRFENMPLAGPDRRFVAMPAYLGGRFDVCGNKWYGSNAANKDRGLPRSVLTVMLNNKDTGEPLTLMSANLLSSARTGAVPGVASRYVVDREAQVVSVLGCGPINRACVEGILSQLPGITRVSCFDINRQAAKALADWVSERFGVKAIVVDDLPESLADADVVSVAASRLVPLHVEEAWFKPTATIMLTGPMLADEALWTNSRIVYDHIQLQEAYVEEGEASGDKENYYSGVIGGPLYRLIDAGKLPALRESTDLGAIVSGREPGRGAEDGRIVFVTCGMAVYDLAWGFDVYRTALDKGIGTTLKLWDEPLSR